MAGRLIRLLYSTKLVSIFNDKYSVFINVSIYESFVYFGNLEMFCFLLFYVYNSLIYTTDDYQRSLSKYGVTLASDKLATF